MSSDMSLGGLTISKALLISIALLDVRSRGQFRLKPWAILCTRGSRVDTVEWLGRNSSWQI